MRPYQVRGRWYRPEEQPAYDEVGLASWYGPGLHGRLTILSVAHRLSTIRDADRILVLSHGRIVELGPHEALMAREGGLYRRLVELQQLSSAEPDGSPDAA